MSKPKPNLKSSVSASRNNDEPEEVNKIETNTTPNDDSNGEANDIFDAIASQ